MSDKSAHFGQDAQCVLDEAIAGLTRAGQVFCDGAPPDIVNDLYIYAMARLGYWQSYVAEALEEDGRWWADVKARPPVVT